MKTKSFFSAMAIALVLLMGVLFNSCKKEDDVTPISFAVVSTTPVNKSKDVPLNTVIKITFNKKILFDRGCFFYSATQGNSGLLWEISYDNDKTVTIKFSGRGLVQNDEVCISIIDLKSVDGDVLISAEKSECGGSMPYSLTFFTVK